MNYVIIKYATHLEEREERWQKIESCIREKLVKRAIRMFNIKGKFDVLQQTFFAVLL
jgi:hypothetical protein